MDQDQVRILQAQAPRRCAFCHDSVGESHHACTKCGAVHHADCLRENGSYCASCNWFEHVKGASVFAAPSRAERRRAPASEERLRRMGLGCLAVGVVSTLVAAIGAQLASDLTAVLGATFGVLCGLGGLLSLGGWLMRRATRRSLDRYAEWLGRQQPRD